MRRPRTRAECAHGPRPCPWFGCRHHLRLELLTAQRLEPELRIAHVAADVPTCSLDVADEGANTLDLIGRCIGVSRERVRQIEDRALRKLRALLPGTALAGLLRESASEASAPMPADATDAEP